MRKIREEDRIVACPICGQSDMMMVSDEETFEELKEEKDCVTVCIECYRCGLMVYSHHGKTTEDDSYKAHMKVARNRWNMLG